MGFLFVSIVALTAAALTFFSGFGLGTLLLPAFALFFPVQLAVAATAVVHLTNNLFKLTLVGRHASPSALLRFGAPAAAAAFVGALLLKAVSNLSALACYELAGRACEITPVKLVIAALMFGFALLELLPRFKSLAFDRKWLPLGGAISGFFGGLSGHQGAFRSAFLLQVGLTKEGFIGTGVACAVIVDVARILVYGASFFTGNFRALDAGGGVALVGTATAAAFIGSFAGSRLVRKMTLRRIQLLVGGLLFALSLALGAGLI